MKIRLIVKIMVLVAVILLFCQFGFAQEADSAKAVSGVAKLYGMPVSIETQAIENQASSPPLPDNNIPAPSNSAEGMTAGDKLKFGFDKAFRSPGTFIFPALSAARQQLDEDKPNKDFGDEFADGMSRYARNYGTAASRALLVDGVYPVIFKQNPRYEPSRNRGFGSRVLHAVSRVFVIRGDNGNLQFNSSRMAGSLSASALANIWERSSPGHDRIGVSPTFRRFGTMIAFDLVKFIVLKEFGHDLIKILPGR
jgi:hypothetical protein